jgi:glycosyltransferase involved in cell wall biosynthesis
VRVLYLSYTGLAEPLGRSQVLPYVLGLARRGHEFVVVSFEKPPQATHLSAEEIRRILPTAVRWVPLKYHKRPTLTATAFDIANGVLHGLRASSIDLIHARSTVPALMARAVALAKGRPWLFDVRGFLAQEYVDGGHWSANSALALTTSALERSLLASASGLVFLTHKALESCSAGRARPTAVIPCAVDLGRFQRDESAGRTMRSRYGIDGRLMVYAGSLGSWYLADQMLDFFLAARARFGDLRFLALTANPEQVLLAAERRGVREQVVAVSVTPDEVPAHLSAADFGVSFVAPVPSKAASSPTKIAEYLACGLPVVSNSGVGDVQQQAQGAPWVVVNAFEPREFDAAASGVARLLAEASVRADARLAAERLFSLTNAIASYGELYEAAGRSHG